MNKRRASGLSFSRKKRKNNMKIVKEVLLSNCGEVELNGEIPKDDEYYLKEYYCDKLHFTKSSNTMDKYLN